MSQKYRILLLAVGIFIGLAVIGAPLVSKAMPYIRQRELTIKEPIDPYIDQIKAYQEELQRADLTSETRALIEKKLNTISMMATQRADGKSLQPTRYAQEQATPTLLIDSVRLPDGIDNHPSVPFSESTVTVINSWRKTTNERYYLVFAGYLTQDPQQGAILVLHPRTHDFKHYETPNPYGGVKVIEEIGTTIVLESTDGVLFYFDAESERFVDDNGTPIPIPTSHPTPYP
jgi:hypothetical protein